MGNFAVNCLSRNPNFADFLSYDIDFHKLEKKSQKGWRQMKLSKSSDIQIFFIQKYLKMGLLF